MLIDTGPTLDLVLLPGPWWEEPWWEEPWWEEPAPVFSFTWTGPQPAAPTAVPGGATGNRREETFTPTRS